MKWLNYQERRNGICRFVMFLFLLALLGNVCIATFAVLMEIEAKEIDKMVEKDQKRVLLSRIAVSKLDSIYYYLSALREVKNEDIIHKLAYEKTVSLERLLDENREYFEEGDIAMQEQIIASVRSILCLRDSVNTWGSQERKLRRQLLECIGKNYYLNGMYEDEYSK